ncbi:MAG: ABC transporter ATP-binding protein [Brevinematales bacterium]|nr:ABC transporter ATP-binding protein [Brevinematales bacterium]
MIEVCNVSKTLQGRTIIEDISFSLKEQEIIGIVGPDGAGKSTLTRIIAGLLKPTTGRVLVYGKDLHDSSSLSFLKETIAYMPQKFALYEDLSVEENLHFIGRLHGLPHKERVRKIERLYQFSNLKPFRTRLAGHLSGGMKQKLGLMCALMHAPKILILDEPTNGVDPVSRREFWELLYELLKENISIIFTTSYMEEAERCARVAVMYEGRFLFLKKSEEIASLIPEEVVECIVEHPLALSHILHKHQEVKAFIRGNTLVVFSHNVEKDMAHLATLLGIPLSWKRKKPSLEDVFMAWLSK